MDVPGSEGIQKKGDDTAAEGAPNPNTFQRHVLHRKFVSRIVTTMLEYIRHVTAMKKTLKHGLEKKVKKKKRDCTV